MPVKDVVRAAVAQVAVEWLEPAKNAETIRATLLDGRKMGAELVVFPELISSGYIIAGRDATFMSQYLESAIEVPGEFTQMVADAVREAGCHAVVGVARRHPTLPGGLYNSSLLFDPAGHIVHVYDKIHLPTFEKLYFFEGSQLHCISTDLATIGQLICADNSFPEAPRTLALAGAEIITVSYARPAIATTELYRAIVQTRAFENQCFVLAASRVGEQVLGDRMVKFGGRSVIAAPDGSVLAESHSEDEEELLVADLRRRDLEGARIWDARFRDRRPFSYRALLE